ncbi:hypothetical protein ACUV84_013630 [Puccinellia chinampoensis]
MQRLEALSDLLASIAKGVAEEEQAGAAAEAHDDGRSLDRLCRLTRLMDDLAAEEKLLRLAVDRMAATSGQAGLAGRGRRPTRKRRPNSRYAAADWTSSSSGAEEKTRRSSATS